MMRFSPNFTELRHCRRGNFAMMTAILLPLLIGAAGFAVDTANVFSKKAELQEALDAATLAASGLKDDEARRRETFASILKANLTGDESLSRLDANLDFDRGVNYISTRASASADVKLSLLSMFRGDVRVSVSAQAYQSTKDLEVAMVLDNTGSLGSSGIEAVRDAAKAMVDVLDRADSPENPTRVSLVPFVTAVNVKGEGYKPDWIDMDGDAEFNGVNFGNGKHDHMWLFDKLGVDWKGCVEARPAPYNVRDTKPDRSNPDTLFVPYFAPDEPGDAAGPRDSATGYNNSYLDDQVGGDEAKRQKSIAKYTSKKDKDKLAKIDEIAPLTNGPNRSCPTPIVPLTSDFEKVRGEVAKMHYWNGSGTNVSEGLAWGWRVLSPEPPYDQAKPFDPDKTTKVVVLFTDGDNVVYGARNTRNKSDYGAYGFLASNRFGTTDQNRAARKVDDNTLSMCTQLKNRNVRIFTVLLNAESASNKALYSACVSAPENYYAISNKAELKDVFAKIGAQVTQLYLVN